MRKTRKDWKCKCTDRRLCDFHKNQVLVNSGTTYAAHKTSDYGKKRRPEKY